MRNSKLYREIFDTEGDGTGRRAQDPSPLQAALRGMDGTFNPLDHMLQTQRRRNAPGEMTEDSQPTTTYRGL